MSVAVSHARVLVAHVEIPNGGDGLAAFLNTHCDEPFHFPRMPPAFACSAFLARATHAEWALIADELVMPDWLEEEVIVWARSQGLVIKAHQTSAPVAQASAPEVWKVSQMPKTPGTRNLFNPEKVLWLAKNPEGFHVSPKEAERFSDLDEIVTDLHGRGELEKIRSDDSGEYYRTTHEGLISLYKLRIAWRAANGKSTEDEEAHLKVLEANNSQDAI
ncbi:hypothetical protein QO021_28420 (plasmid) [Pseudomonas amygdali pv. lachrymans]|uniref:hypothetical protein n=1 Tax=Pseudomonas amygdali TaxID=47877 RepID=UPI000F3BC5A6|nr:hypothetical protein [Pseudomonas amygdali]RMM39514.1 hypothetical protein ALQ79_200695 [Pseudomonas amygdali pv. lachrymans]WIO61484.1 hypothetical protein QO021_28420 [Pseudomonas amygdali pv. lachrymans]